MGRYLSTKQVMGDSDHKNMFQGFFGPIHIFVHVTVASGAECNHCMGYAAPHGHCWQCKPAEQQPLLNHSRSLGVHPGCPHPQLHWDIEPPCHFQRLSFCSGYNGSCCRSFPFPHAFTDTSRAANLNYCPLPPTQ